jgi:hypothetical protein
MSITLLEDTQASAFCPSDRNSTKMKNEGVRTGTAVTRVRLNCIEKISSFFTVNRLSLHCSEVSLCCVGK